MNIEIEMENGGIIKAELYPDVAPITVENFVSLIERNFFDGLIFHRVIPGFMIQGGGFTADGQHKETDSISLKSRLFRLPESFCTPSIMIKGVPMFLIWILGAAPGRPLS